MAITHSELFVKKIVLRSAFILPLVFVLVVICINLLFGSMTGIAENQETLPIYATLFLVMGCGVPIVMRLILKKRLKNQKQDFGILVYLMQVSVLPLLLGLFIRNIIYFLGFFVISYLLLFWNFMLVKQWEQKMEELELRNRLNG